MKFTAYHIRQANDFAASRPFTGVEQFDRDMADHLNAQAAQRRRQRRVRAGLILEWLGAGQLVLGIAAMFAFGFTVGMIGIATGVVMGVLGYGMGEDE